MITISFQRLEHAGHPALIHSQPRMFLLGISRTPRISPQGIKWEYSLWNETLDRLAATWPQISGQATQLSVFVQWTHPHWFPLSSWSPLWKQKGSWAKDVKPRDDKPRNKHNYIFLLTTGSYNYNICETDLLWSEKNKKTHAGHLKGPSKSWVFKGVLRKESWESQMHWCSEKWFLFLSSLLTPGEKQQ